MKHISFAANIVLAAIIFYIVSNESKGKSNIVANNATIHRLSSFDLNRKGTAPFADSVYCERDSFYGLTVNEFIRGIARYRKTHWNRINSDPWYRRVKGARDARADWYSIDTLKKYICLIEKYSRRLGIKSDRLGIRFYYATYPAKRVWQPAYAGLHTLFMVPTYRSERGNVDFDPRYSQLRESQEIYTIAAMYAADSSAQVFVLDGSTANDEMLDAGRNQGQLCPPTCPERTTAMLVADASYPLGLDR